MLFISTLQNKRIKPFLSLTGLKEAEIKETFLLTETAMDYFKKLGFTIRERTTIPETVTTTRQFKELCPSSAIIMIKSYLV